MLRDVPIYNYLSEFLVFSFYWKNFKLCWRNRGKISIARAVIFQQRATMGRIEWAASLCLLIHIEQGLLSPIGRQIRGRKASQLSKENKRGKTEDWKGTAITSQFNTSKIWFLRTYLTVLSAFSPTWIMIKAMGWGRLQKKNNKQPLSSPVCFQTKSLIPHPN